MSDPEKILSRYWGFSSFKPLQQEIIQDLLQGKDVIGLLPTGGGKSLCFQVPALAMPGICIVISPLVALMEDQINTLQEKGIKALAITGGLPFSEVDTLLDNCIYGNYKFLYLSPERLQQEIVRERLRQMPVNLIAIDEAHCISQWGHDFRPAYSEIAALRDILPGIPMIGLTATATAKVVVDIAEQLEMTDPAIHKMSFERKNLAYLVQEVQDKNASLLNLLKEDPEPAIVYVRSRKATVGLTALLEANGISANCYHGGLLKKEKSQRLKRWLKQEDRVMVATNAFGMGIDKPNVRSVIHMNLPDSLEGYFQEAGRAGRDGALSKAVILTDKGDITVLKDQFMQLLPSVELVKLVYKKIVTYFRIAYGEGEGTEHYFNFYEFCQTYQLNTMQTYNALSLLDRTSVLSLAEQYQKRSKIRFVVPGTQLTYFLEANPQFEAVVKAILRTYGGVFDDMVEIDLKTICNKAGTNQPEAVRLLKQLTTQEIAEFENNQFDTKVTFLVPREDDKTIHPLIPHIQRQLDTKKKKIDSVLAYVANDRLCKSQQLLQYFGETHTKPCGICSVCKPDLVRPTRNEMKEVYYRIKNLLTEEELQAGEIIEKLDFPEHHVLYVLQTLLEKDALIFTTDKRYKLKKL